MLYLHNECSYIDNVQFFFKAEAYSTAFPGAPGRGMTYPSAPIMGHLYPHTPIGSWQSSYTLCGGMDFTLHPNQGAQPYPTPLQRDMAGFTPLHEGMACPCAPSKEWTSWQARQRPGSCWRRRTWQASQLPPGSAWVPSWAGCWEEWWAGSVPWSTPRWRRQPQRSRWWWWKEGGWGG